MTGKQKSPKNETRLSTGNGEIGETETQDLTIWLAAWRAYTSANRMMLRQFGVTAQQYAALIEIHCSNDPHGLSIGELAAALHIGHNTAVQLVNKLCKKEYANRSRHEFDRRVAHLKLTVSGRATLGDLLRIHHREFRNIRPELVGSLEK